MQKSVQKQSNQIETKYSLPSSAVGSEEIGQTGSNWHKVSIKSDNDSSKVSRKATQNAQNTFASNLEADNLQQQKIHFE